MHNDCGTFAAMSMANVPHSQVGQVAANMPHMQNPLYERIMARLEELGLSPNEASERASNGANRDLIRKLNRPNAYPSARSAPGLAAVLGWPLEDLMPAKLPREVRRPGLAVPAPIAPFDPLNLPQDVDVLGTAAGSLVGSFAMDGAIERVRRPPGIATARNVYALFVTGDSMMPRHRHGDLIFVSADRPVAAGDDVIIQTQDYEGAPVLSWIKELVRRTDAEVRVRQLNPESTVSFKAPQVKAVHRVLTTRELFGV